MYNARKQSPVEEFFRKEIEEIERLLPSMQELEQTHLRNYRRTQDAVAATRALYASGKKVMSTVESKALEDAMESARTTFEDFKKTYGLLLTHLGFLRGRLESFN